MCSDHLFVATDMLRSTHARPAKWYARIFGAWQSSSDVRNQTIFLYFAYAMCALLFTMIFNRMTHSYERATLADLTAFKAHTPFQYRILTPAIAHAVTMVMPVKVSRIYFVITAVSTLLLLAAFRRYLSCFLPERASGPLTFGVLYPLLWNYCVLGGPYYPSDIPCILFFVLGLTCLYRRRMAPYYLVFVLATLNRETSILLALTYLIVVFGTTSLRKMLIHIGAQLFIWVAVKVSLTALFAANPGAKVFELMFWENIKMFSRLIHGDLFAMSRLFAFGLVYLAIPLAWRQLPVFLKKCLIVGIPFVAGIAVVAVLHETRVFNELVPIITAPALFSIYSFFNRKESVRCAPGG